MSITLAAALDINDKSIWSRQLKLNLKVQVDAPAVIRFIKKQQYVKNA
jgi:hypothetical protein